MWAALRTGATAVYQGKHAELHPFLLQNLQLLLALCVCMVGCSRMQGVGRCSASSCYKQACNTAAEQFSALYLSWEEQ